MKVRSSKDRLTEHFTNKEMKCKCRKEDCSSKPMDKAFMQKLEALRKDWGIPLLPTSAARCEAWNVKVGGSPHSQHLLGKACDFWFDHPSDVLAFVELAEKHGFGGIGVGKHLVHVDGRSERGRWVYRDK